jgi:hypothetical protein
VLHQETKSLFDVRFKKGSVHLLEMHQ